MPAKGFLSVSAQVAAHLRTEMARGVWGGKMPGRDRLAAELGVNRKTVESALRQLEREGVLAGQGAGRKRQIIMPPGGVALRPLQVTILLGEPSDRQQSYIVELRHALANAGHQVSLAGRTLVDLKMEVKRIGRLVERTDADAWVVVAGSREVLEWFAARAVPVFALFGRRRGVPIAAIGPDKVSTTTAATRRLIALGHHRIVTLARPRRRLPQPGAGERAFLEAMTAHGIPTGAYNMPDWKETVEGFNGCLDSLFRVTPPTALIVDEAPFVTAALLFLARRGLRVPEDVSLVCTDHDPSFEWCDPPIAHIRWNSQPVVRRILQWSTNVSCGKEDLRQTLIPAEFIAGGTIGPARKE